MLLRNALAGLVVAMAAVTAVAAENPSPAYRWTNVAMGGGGAVPGLVLHPKVADLAYVRTDVGGAYRWEAKSGRWVPLLDSVAFTEWNLYGVDSIAVDPTDASGNTVYLTTGKYTDAWAKPLGMLMKSTDRGETWKRLPLSPTGASNNDQGCGERLAIDPGDGRHLIYGARIGGLFESTDAGESWQRVAAAPAGAQPDAADKKRRGQGLAFALFDPSGGRIDGGSGRTKTIYVGASQDGVYRSQDAGATWQRLAGGPDNPRRGVIAPDGTLVVSSGKGLYRYADDRWSVITPPGDGGCCGVGVDPRDPRRIVANVGGSHNAGVFLSTDAGKTWRDVRGKRNPTAAWWPAWHWLSNPFSFTFDPHHPGRVWATDWYGTYTCDDIDAAKPVWTNHVAGTEEIVTIGALLAPATGPYRLFSGDADIGGMDHESLLTPPASTIWGKGLSGGMARTGIAISGSDPNFLATVCTRDWSDPGTGAYSLDAGRHWMMFPTLPDAKVHGGRVVLPGKGRRILWLPQKRPPFYTDDLGKTWMPVRSDVDLTGAAHGDGIFAFDQPLAVDLADSNRVYLLHRGKLCVSNDGGGSFAVVASGLSDTGNNKIATSGRPNDVWMSAGDRGLLRSTDGGKSFTPADAVQNANLFSFGKAPPGKSFPALFVQGRVNNVNGYFRSDDAGARWTQIDTPAQRVGNDPNTMTGDWRVYGGVFVGTNGRGIFYGCPADAPPER